MNSNDAPLAKERLEQAQRKGDPEQIARTLASNLWPLYSSHYELMTRAIVALPSSVLERYPTLRLIHPMTRVLARTTRPFKPLVLPDEAKSMEPDELDLLTVAQIIAFRTSGDIESSLLYAKRLEERIIRVRVEMRERTDGPLWYFHLEIGSTLLAAGQTSQALLDFSTARQLAGYALQEDGARMVLSRIALTHAIRGSYDYASAALAEALAEPALSPAHVASFQATEAAAAALIAVDSMADDLDEALQRLEPYDSFELTWPFALLARTRASLARHHPEDALEMVRLAQDAHRVQDGTFGSDVISSATIEALTSMGHGMATPRMARALATPAPGVLTRLAMARLALHDGNLRSADAGIRDLLGDDLLGPAHRAETTLLAAWLDFARTDDVDDLAARQLLRIAGNRHARRLFTSMPRQFVDRVQARLSAADAQRFVTALAGLPLADAQSRPRLTRSEVRVLKALTSNATTAMIASALHISPNTVKSQLQSAYRKLNVSTREEALRTAFRLRLIDPSVRTTGRASTTSPAPFSGSSPAQMR